MVEQSTGQDRRTEHAAHISFAGWAQLDVVGPSVGGAGGLAVLLRLLKLLRLCRRTWDGAKAETCCTFFDSPHYVVS